MFNSKEKETRGQGTMESNVIGGSNKISINGDIKAESDIRLMCNLTGNIDCTGEVTIATEGSILGDIVAKELNIEIGTIKGNVRASKIVIGSNAILIGDIFANSLVIREGGQFYGRSCKVEEVKDNKPMKQQDNHKGAEIDRT